MAVTCTNCGARHLTGPAPTVETCRECDRPNYPGGFHATIVRVFLYADGRTNFRLLRWQNDGGTEQPPDAIDKRNEARAVASCDLDVTGLAWSDLVAATMTAADEMRGCSWETWQKRKNPPDARHDGWFTTELTPEGEQHVIPGCERNNSPRATQLDLFG